MDISDNGEDLSEIFLLNSYKKVNLYLDAYFAFGGVWTAEARRFYANYGEFKRKFHMSAKANPNATMNSGGHFDENMSATSRIIDDSKEKIYKRCHTRWVVK